MMTPHYSITTSQTNGVTTTDYIPEIEPLMIACDTAIIIITEILDKAEELAIKQQQSRKKYGSGGKLLKKHDFFNR